MMINGLNSWEQEAYGVLFPDGNGVLDQQNIRYRHSGPGSRVTIEPWEDGWQVTLEEQASFGRSLTLLEEAVTTGRPAAEAPVYPSLGMLLDCSRGAVPTVKTVGTLLRILARMGYHSLQLYMEDTCALSQYSYWGYRRGAYTAEELKEMDRLGASMGIELIPAVQTLAHMGQALKWPAFSDIKDTDGIFLIGEEKTYELIDTLFAHLSQTFLTRRINIGMDEAHMVGLGEYLNRHGYEDRLQVMLQHFKRVHQLAVRHGLRPMMWSDMFFRLAAGGEYYAPDALIDSRVAELLPQDVNLIYWDYYSEHPDIYDRMLDKHKQITDHLMFAGGAWKWRGFGPGNRFSIKLARIAHASCLKHKIKEVLVTAWGDNGAECALFGILPALQYWAELCYGHEEEDTIRRHFKTSCGGDWDRFLLLDEPMFTPHNPAPGRCEVNAPKYLFYQDILSGLFDAHVQPDEYERHFEECERKLKQAAADSREEWKYLFEVQSQFCRVLKTKCRIGLDLRHAYANGDKEQLGILCRNRLQELKEALLEFSNLYYDQWFRENKAAGYDIIDLRIGGMLKRMDTAQQRIEAYLCGRISSLEELECPLLPYDPKTGEDGAVDLAGPFWHRIASASNIASI